MNILVHSPAFLPLVGGLENQAAMLCQGLAGFGHKIVLWTTTTGDGAPQDPSYEVVRNPSWLRVLGLVRQSDVVVHMNVSLRGLWPLLIVPRPWVVSHHTWYRRGSGVIAWRDSLKRWSLRFARASIAASRALAVDLDTPTIVVPNGYRDDLFCRLPDEQRDTELIFVGRLVSEKGVDLLLDAMQGLAHRGVSCRLSICGTGPEFGALERKARDLGLTERVTFLGRRTGHSLVEAMNRHRILVVPSRCNETFGIVALEGIASGCVVIGTAGGGLPEAIGPCGLVVPNGDAAALADAIEPFVNDPDLCQKYLSHAANHLASKTARAMSSGYLRVIEEALGCTGPIRAERPREDSESDRSEVRLATRLRSEQQGRVVQPSPTMKILFYSPAFAPQIGGLEINVATLCRELTRLGHEVVVWTTTPGPTLQDGYRVLRRPGPRAVLRSMHWCQFFVHENVGLKGVWPLLFIRRPWILRHHSWYLRPSGRVGWRDYLKRHSVRWAQASLAASTSLAEGLSGSTLLPNPYRADVFRVMPEIPRTKDLVFVGRVVSEKGADLLLDALALLASKELRPTLSVVGEGPEVATLKAQSEMLGLQGHVQFLGLVRDAELARALNAHRILVVPSRYDEPFGNVALEGIACGCAIVASRGGGLPEAVGPCGRLFPNGDAAALAGVLENLLRDPAGCSALTTHAEQHLARHHPAHVAAEFVSALRAVTSRRFARTDDHRGAMQ